MKTLKLIPLLANPALNAERVAFLFKDDFTTADAAPIDVPRNAEPGPGVWGTTTDTGNRLSIASGDLAAAAGGSVSDPNLISTTTFARLTGLALAYIHKAVAVTNQAAVLFRSNTSSADIRCQLGTSLAVTSAVSVYNNALFTPYVITTLSLAGLDISLFTILRTAGFWSIYKRAGVYKLAIVISSGTNNNMPLHMGAASVATFDKVRVARLPPPWTNDDNLLTYREAAPSSGDTQTSEANAIHVVNWTPAANATLEIILRRTDDTHEWIARYDQAGGTMKIIEDNAGETERSSVASTITPGVTYREVVRADDTYIRAMHVQEGVYSTAATYTAASSNQTATGTQITYTNTTTITDWEAWQVDIPAASTAALTEMLA